MENEKQKEKNDSGQKKKNNLVIDYSKFQSNFLNNIQKEEKVEKNKIEQKENNQNQTQRLNNYDQFLNVSELLNDNMSQSSLIDLESQKNKTEVDNKEKGNKINNKINKSILNNNSDNFSIGESDDPNLQMGYNDLILSYNDINRKKRLEKVGDFKDNKEFNNTTLNSYRKKKNYVKFINKNNFQLELSKTSDKEKMSYAKINEKNRLFKEKNYKNKNLIKKDKFNLLNEINNNYNNSVLTLSDISIVPSTTTTVDFITGNNSNTFSNKSYYNNIKVNNNKKIKINQKIKNNNQIMNKNNKNNKRNNSNEYTYHSVNELNLMNSNHNKKRKRSYEKQNNLMIYVNKSKKNENKSQKDDLIDLLDNIKTKYQDQENEFKNQQKNMKSEIEILREKLKTLSVNEALYQVEIEKLKRKNNNNNEYNNINNSNITSNNVLIKDNNIPDKLFEKKLDDIIKKHNKENNNINLYSFSKKSTNSKFEQLLDYFNLDKNIFSDENFFFENEESFNYEKAFSDYPQIKKFIEILIEKYKNEREYRTRLEEKTVEIFTNDMKTINILENKIKKYEENNKQYKINSSLNMSLDVGNNDNMTKNHYKSCKSCDKLI